MIQQPSDERKMALVREKTNELQQLTHIKESSDRLVQYLEEVANIMRDLSQGAQGNKLSMHSFVNVQAVKRLALWQKT